MPGAPGDDEWKEDPGGIPALTGWGNYRWNVTTSNDSAQYYFNQGINMYYSFHMVEAKGSFVKAYTFDPTCAMAYWGLALAEGPNINYPDVSTQANKNALEAIENAGKNIDNKSPLEQALIKAIASRYSPDSTASREKLNADYAAAMKAVYEQYASNAEAGALYADALMVQHPWDLYEQNEQPKAWTPQLVSVIEKTLAKFPDHPGVNHYYIHAVEASANPGKALPSADKLSLMMPNVAHMVHMPSHTYIRTGNYQQGIDVNTSAIKGFYLYAKEYPPVEELAGLYLSHNQHMQIACAMMQGSSKTSFDVASQTRQLIPDSYFAEPSAFGNYLQSIHMMPTVAAIRFAKWQAILDSSMVNESMLGFEYAFQLFAKGMAAAHTGKLGDAATYLQQMQEKMKLPVLSEKYAPFANPALDALKVSEQLLQGVIAEKSNKLSDAIAYYNKAVALEDGMLYGEPKDWLLPARHYLGHALLSAKQFAEAEAVYKKDLAVNPHNPWSLQGLLQAQKGQNKNADAAKTQTAFTKAAAHADVKISGSVLN